MQTWLLGPSVRLMLGLSAAATDGMWSSNAECGGFGVHAFCFVCFSLNDLCVCHNFDAFLSGRTFP